MQSRSGLIKSGAADRQSTVCGFGLTSIVPYIFESNWLRKVHFASGRLGATLGTSATYDKFVIPAGRVGLGSTDSFLLPVSGWKTIAPDSTGEAGALQRIGYSLESAIADLVDNSIDARASTVLIRFFTTDSNISSIAIVDDGEGMNESTLHSAMKFGVQRKHRTKDLGKYGIGLKTASISQCHTLSVLSRQNGVVNGRRWTLRKMKEGWRCAVLDTPACKRIFEREWCGLKLQKHGTIVLWEDLQTLQMQEEDFDKAFRRTRKRLLVELGIRFHRFLQQERLRILVDVQNESAREPSIPTEVEALDPFGYKASGDSGFPATFKVSLPKHGTLMLEAHIWPPKSKTPEYKLGGGKIAERQGFYFYRNDRIIQAGGWNEVYASDSEPHSSLARVAIELPASMDAAFNLTVDKNKVIPPPGFAMAVRSSKCGSTTFNDYMDVARAVYRKKKSKKTEIFVPGPGLSSPLQKKMASFLGANNGNTSAVCFDWVPLQENELFSVDPHAKSILLNETYRTLFADKGERRATDAPILKLLLFLLCAPEMRRSRISNKVKEHYDTCNKLILEALKELQ